MKLIAQFENPKRFIIEHDKAVGFYFYIFEGDRCVRDELQDTLEMAIEIAFENYQIPRNVGNLARPKRYSFSNQVF
jgi:hypothetical protein